VLRISSSIADLGGMVWGQLISLFITWIIIYLCVAKGIESVSIYLYMESNRNRFWFQRLFQFTIQKYVVKTKKKYFNV